jgi:hypothetical protein
LWQLAGIQFCNPYVGFRPQSGIWSGKIRCPKAVDDHFNLEGLFAAIAVCRLGGNAAIALNQAFSWRKFAAHLVYDHEYFNQKLQPS